MPGGIIPGEKLDPEGAKALALVGGGLEQLTHLNLKSLFCFFTTTLQTLSRLLMSHRTFIRSIAEFVPVARVIMSDNRIGGKGAMALAPALGRFIHLQQLNLECESSIVLCIRAFVPYG